MTKTLTGGCCCGEVSLKSLITLGVFLLPLRTMPRLTGTAHAANLFTSPDAIECKRPTAYNTV